MARNYLFTCGINQTYFGFALAFLSCIFCLSFFVVCLDYLHISTLMLIIQYPFKENMLYYLQHTDIYLYKIHYYSCCNLHNI